LREEPTGTDERLRRASTESADRFVELKPIKLK